MPLVKLGYLFVRTIAKPIASGIKSHAREHPKFRAFFTGIAQSYHRLEVRLRNRIALKNGSSSDTEPLAQVVKPLDEQKAIDLGANFVGEAVVFLVAGAVLVADQTQSWKKEQARRAFIEHRIDGLYAETQALRRELEQCCSKQPTAIKG